MEKIDALGMAAGIALLSLIVGCAMGSYFQKVHLANGYLACEYYRSELICWNPKEEEK